MLKLLMALVKFRNPVSRLLHQIGSIYTKGIGRVLTWAPHSPSTAGWRSRGGAGGPALPAWASRRPLICFTNTRLYRSQIARLLSHRTKVTPTDPRWRLALSRRTQPGLSAFIWGPGHRGGKFQAPAACRWSGSSSSETERAALGVSRPWAATGPWSALPAALAPALRLRPPGPRPGGSPSSPTRASGFPRRPIPQTGSPGAETGVSAAPSPLLDKHPFPWQRGCCRGGACGPDPALQLQAGLLASQPRRSRGRADLCG